MNDLKAVTHAENVRLREDGRAVVILDQSRLPLETVYREVSEAEEMYDAVFELQVRGAPAIGIFSGYCMYVLAQRYLDENPDADRDDFRDAMAGYAEYLISSRPTAVNLAWAVHRIMKAAESEESPEGSAAAMKEEAVEIHKEDIQMCRAISEYGLTVVKDGDGILTHCNAGPLATSVYGTALGPILLGKERGMEFRVFADETRPLLQGARLTAYELQKAGVDVTLICDNMASMVMKNGWIQACFVGCDRIAANGDTANKIGTSSVAVLAKYYGIPFYVLGPTSTIDTGCPSGSDIPIELRPEEEIRSRFYARPAAPAGVKCYNPAFDVTDNSLISGIITEKGICRQPFTESLRKITE